MLKFKEIKIYIAAPFFNPEQLELVKKIEEVILFSGLMSFSPRLEGKVIKDLPESERENAATEAFNMNIKGLKDSNTLLLVLDGKDLGSAFECGYWVGQHGVKSSLRPVIMFQSINKPLNIMLQQIAYSYTKGIDDLARYISKIKDKGLVTASSEYRNFGTNLT